MLSCKVMKFLFTKQDELLIVEEFIWKDEWVHKLDNLCVLGVYNDNGNDDDDGAVFKLLCVPTLTLTLEKDDIFTVCFNWW